jgi:hypothetical protein
MPKSTGKRHTAKEHKIFDAVKRSNPTMSARSAWKITMANSSKQRARKGAEPNTINYKGRKKR